MINDSDNIPKNENKFNILNFYTDSNSALKLLKLNIRENIIKRNL